MIHSHIGHNPVLLHQSSAHNILIAFFLNLTFTVIAVAGGLITDSNAILSESVHNLGCTLSLGLAWVFQRMAAKPATDKYPFGYRRFALLGALINATVITIGSILMLVESFGGLSEHEHGEIMANGMFWIALAGIFFKGVAVLQTRGKGANERMVSLHLLSDMMGWVAVLIVSIVLLFVDIPKLDSILSVLISVYILINVIRGLCDVFSVLMESLPKQIDSVMLRNEIEHLQGVSSLSSLRVWGLDGESSAAMLTISLSADADVTATKTSIRTLLKSKNISDISIEIE